MISSSEQFKVLFKKYRLKGEISTLSEFGNALAEKGFIYEDSIFSHWQKGTRIPQNRKIVLKLIEIFTDKQAITTLNEANQLLSAVSMMALTDEEIQKTHLKLANPIFQVPVEIENFTGREKIIDHLSNNTNIKGKVILIHGAAGVGKTSLGIKLGHLLKEKFSDGVFWYKVEEDNIADILLSIAKLLGEDISGIKDVKIRSTVVRSLLVSKDILLFLDSAELYENIHLLVPDSTSCTVVLISQKNHFKDPTNLIDIKLEPFSDEEVVALFKDVLRDKFPKNGKGLLLNISQKVGNLPLAVDILAKELLHGNIGVAQLPSFIKHESSLFDNLTYEDKSLYSAISMSYKKLDVRTKSVLVSASIFKGKDFSLDSIAYLNGLSKHSALKILQNLIDLSLMELSTKNRFRIHPAIKEFVRNQLNYPRASYLSLIAVLMYCFFMLWWVFLHLFLNKENNSYSIFSACYFVMALYGGIYGINTSIKWGGLKSLLGKAIFMFSIGLFTQVFGQIAYSYYDNILHQNVYPSPGDIGYFGTIPFYIYGVFLLAESSGIKINLKLFREKIIAIIVPIVMVSFAYLLFLQHYVFDFKDPVKIFLDFGYPLGEAIYISIAIIVFILSRTILDGIMRSKALILLIALFAQFITDYLFVYDANNFYPGNYIDFLCLSAYFIMTIALLSLRSIQIKVN